MRKIGSSRIGRHAPKPGFAYPTIRLPQDHAGIIGETVTLFETEHEGKQAFLIVTGKKCAHPGTQPQEIVSLPDYEKRIVELEKRIREIEVSGALSPINPAPFLKTGLDSPSPCKGDVIPLDHEPDNLLMSDWNVLKPSDSSDKNVGTLSTLELIFARTELESCTTARTQNIAPKSVYWIEKSLEILCEIHAGISLPEIWEQMEQIEKKQERRFCWRKTQQS